MINGIASVIGGSSTILVTLANIVSLVNLMTGANGLGVPNATLIIDIRQVQMVKYNHTQHLEAMLNLF